MTQFTSDDQTLALERGQRRPRSWQFWKAGKVLFLDYVVEELLGMGGSSIVYKVRNTLSDDRFALKVPRFSLSQDPRKNRLFFREIRTWIDLPDHPNLTACRFIRTMDDRMVIFAEYVDGGSLRDWIGLQQLLQIDEILDVAIQIAWGLETAHAHGVIHQDVKPANIILNGRRDAKITDFGLSRTFELMEQMHESKPHEPVKIVDPSVSTGIMTPAYCSPEQRYCLKVDQRSDIWSFGLTLLSMFTGIPTWQSGTSARKLLKESKATRNPPYPAIPKPVFQLLEKCFRLNPQLRWQSMEVISRKLCDLYITLTGKPYPREKPDIIQDVSCQADGDWRSFQDFNWSDPCYWLKKTAAYIGATGVSVDQWLKEYTGSVEALRLIDMEIFERAKKRFEAALELGHLELRSDYIDMLYEKAGLHHALDDPAGAVRESTEAVRVMRELIASSASLDNTLKLCHLLNDNAKTLVKAGRAYESFTSFDLAAQLLKNIKPGTKYKNEVLKRQFAVYYSKAVTLNNIRECNKAIKVFNEAERVLAQIDFPADTRKEKSCLLNYYKTIALTEIDRFNQAIALGDQTIKLMRHLVRKNEYKYLEPLLASSYTNRAVACVKGGYNDRIDEYFKAAHRVFRRLIENEGQHVLIPSLAANSISHGIFLDKTGHHKKAHSCFQSAVEALEYTVFKEGQRHHLDLLCKAYGNKAIVLDRLELKAEAEQYDWKCIRILEKRIREDRQSYHSKQMNRVIDRQKSRCGQNDVKKMKHLKKVSAWVRTMVSDPALD